MHAVQHTMDGTAERRGAGGNGGGCSGKLFWRSGVDCARCCCFILVYFLIGRLHKISLDRIARSLPFASAPPFGVLASASRPAANLSAERDHLTMLSRAFCDLRVWSHCTK